nr:peroxisomal adenine nucleotide transporter 1 [Quercus suber]
MLDCRWCNRMHAPRLALWGMRISAASRSICCLFRLHTTFVDGYRWGIESRNRRTIINTLARRALVPWNSDLPRNIRMAAKNEVPPWGLAIAGSAGAVFANALVYPLDIVKTKLQVQVKRHSTDPERAIGDAPHYKGTLHAIQLILADEGLAGLYNGLAGGLLGVASTNFAYFYWYSIVRDVYLTRISSTGKPPNTAMELSLGAIAGALAQIFTIPIAVVTTRQQTQPKHDKKGMMATAREVVNSEDGYAGLWRGIKASMVLVVNPAITYGAYQRLKDTLYPAKNNLAAHEAFRESSHMLEHFLIRNLTFHEIVLGALSKSIATIVTQPLIVAKVGLQSRPPPGRKGKPFKSFLEVMNYIVEKEGPLGLYKGIAPQIVKGILVQGILMMTKERVELMFVLLFRYVRMMRRQQLDKLAETVRVQATKV